ncbi:pyridoxamine 5'-phosphate oxidase family protein [Actinomadura flavalba]|uniref:pyridoxamine 5'-phosphate oxidase family protein n=1 Tax=Actinomadura flavalba TaxID=1120938 RepID=UPI000369B2B7|nr:pyridoxamine 5'-phosphate oxidase family protein [Actinomadura flavalba]
MHTFSGEGAVPEELDRAECLRLVSPGGVGRVAFDDGEGPAVLPVNYVVDGERIIFRTGLGGRIDFSLTSVLRGARVRVAFEVDSIDFDAREGWSVMLRGGAYHLGADEIAELPVLEPWPKGEKESYIAIDPVETHGRRLAR